MNVVNESNWLNSWIDENIQDKELHKQYKEWAKDVLNSNQPFDKEAFLWVDGSNIGYDIWNGKYRYDNESFDKWLDRVSAYKANIRDLIKERKFLFGGRVLANRGIPNSGQYYNCFSRGYIPDDYSAIMDTLKEIGITFKHQGGQGVSLTQLRPKGTSIGDHYESDGIIPFMRMLNTITEGTSQGGARKGALLISCDIRHKEAMDFITIKTDLNEINKANLSLEVDDEFMTAVQEYYLNGETITLHECKEYSGHKIEYDIVPIKLYKKIMEVVWDYGEPAMIYTDRFRNYNFMEFDDRYNIETCNPCGEQPLKAKSCCNLGSLNLYEFVENKFTDEAYFDFDEFRFAVDYASDALDDIIDENASRMPIELKEYAQNALDWRNIGLGVFGYAYMLMALGLKYGSEEAIKFTDKLFNTLMLYAINSNRLRGIDKGSFPKYDDDLVRKSTIMRNHNLMLETSPLTPIHFRNCSLLSIAPTGSISTMILGGSGGTEPEFALSYTRRTDNLKESYTIDCKAVRDYRKITGNQGELPDYFVCSADIPWRERVDTQAVIQEHIDTAISSTVNLPKETTKEEIEELYLYAWSKGLKGITIFRDGCKRLGILTTENADDNEHVDETPKLKRGDIISVCDDLIGYKRKIINGCGDFQFQLFFDDIDGTPLESYISMGDGGGCDKCLEAISRLISLCFRAGVDVNEVIKQLKKVRPCHSYTNRTKAKGDTSRGTSCPSAIGHALNELNEKIVDRCFDGYMEEYPYETTWVGDTLCVIAEEDEEEMISSPEAHQSLNDDTPTCPDCGSPLIHEGGCDVCRECGFSHCG